MAMIGTAALVLAGAAAAQAQGNGITYQHIPGKKGRINESISRHNDTSAPAAMTTSTDSGSRITNKGGAPDSDIITRLTDDNVRAFIDDVQRIATGETEDMSVDDIAGYLDRHIASDARFKSAMKYEMPGYPAQQNEMDLGKSEYINGVLNGASMMQRYEHSVTVKSVEIGNGGRSAKVVTVIREKGDMPWPEDNPDTSGKTPAKMGDMPVQGESQCEQQIVVGLTNYIQMKGAQCATILSFDPFQKEELGDDMFFGK
jgi:hypothetical protein